MLKVFSKKKVASNESPSIDANSCVYAIGDVHGRLDLLKKIHRKILENSKKYSSYEKHVIYLGDYVDRGKNSKRVIDELINNPLKNEGFKITYLCGNHEYYMMKFMSNPYLADSWLYWGGEETLESYNVEVYNKEKSRIPLKLIQQKINEKVPESHKEFLRKLKMMEIVGDYVFVHAGLRPHVPIQKQSSEDLLNIREDFYESDYVFEKSVVFGHTIFKEPFIGSGKIGIDTGAYNSNILTCLVLEGKKFGFLNT